MTSEVIDWALNNWGTFATKAFKPTPAQFAKMMAAMEPDGDLDKFWAEIELENKNKAGQVFIENDG